MVKNNLIYRIVFNIYNHYKIPNKKFFRLSKTKKEKYQKVLQNKLNKKIKNLIRINKFNHYQKIR